MVFRKKYDDHVGNNKEYVHVLKENAENDGRLGYTLLVITLLTQVGVLSIGYDLGINSGAVLLVENSEYMPLNSLWKQLIIAGALPSAIVITLFASQLSDIIGRKRTVMTAAVSYLVGAIISGAAVNRTMLLIGRLLIGCGHGFTGASTAVYIAECAPVRMRGKLIGLSQPFLTIGILSATIFAGVFSYDTINGWRYMWAFQGIWSVIQFTGLLFMPESPRWLIQKSQFGEGKIALAKLRHGSNVEEEFNEIKKNCEEDMKNSENLGSFQTFVKMMQTQPVRRALLVGCGIQLFAQFSGANTIIYYSGIIIKMAGVGDVSTAIWNSVIINCINLLFAIIGVWLVDLVGRRKLAISGLIGLAFSTCCLATTFLMAIKHTPAVTYNSGQYNSSCMTHSLCSDCVHDPNCGFCYSSNENNMNATCLPSDPKLWQTSAVGACNSTTAMQTASLKWVIDYCPVSFSWVAVVGLAFFLVFYAPTMGPLPWTINAEIYPLWARSTGNGLAAATCWLCNLINSVSFLSLSEAINSYGVFYLLSFMAVSGALFCYFLLPETKGKSLEAIEILFMKDRKKLGNDEQQDLNDQY
ncbi:proton myo-inositol cotransporter isoform X1 [Octopus vulgaris]|uniref:Proton myo-inositol cotransporter isoform X1 n=2 Tax=Octopus TaxID=6643 RepID=A0AA36FID7_OCTVU|nr:proton myo-inositol cotransporter isoform X2 [Octopus sinensis]CAI9740196.1 proton myo-inositol cotransporter isoform X1 [Octopus vulgaris]